MKKIMRIAAFSAALIMVFGSSLSALAVTTGKDDGVIHFSSSADIIPGDVNGDNTVDIRDLVRIKRYLADSSVEIVYKNADIDGKDGIIAYDMAQLRIMLLNK